LNPEGDFVLIAIAMGIFPVDFVLIAIAMSIFPVDFVHKRISQ
jgi:hypothetical protein